MKFFMEKYTIYNHYIMKLHLLFILENIIIKFIKYFKKFSD